MSATGFRLLRACARQCRAQIGYQSPVLSSSLSSYQAGSQQGTRLLQSRGMAAAAVEQASPTTASTASTASATSVPASSRSSCRIPATPQEIDRVLSMHPLTQSLRRDSSYTEARPHLSMPAPLRANHLVAGPVLSGTERLTVPPYLFHSPGAGHLIALMHLGTQVSGHPGFVHGGLMAVLFDEIFARCACPALPKAVAVTANLNVDFRSPGLLGRLYVLQARTVQVEGRKAWVEGTLEMLPGWLDGRQQEEAGGDESSAVLVAEAKALFIEPKFADSLPQLYKS